LETIWLRNKKIKKIAKAPVHLAPTPLLEKTRRGVTVNVIESFS